MKPAQDRVILIVDDEPDIREIIGDEFRDADYCVLEAGNGEEAFEMVKQRNPDAVITDIRMPGGDGMTLLDRIKQLSPKTPIVMLVTGFSDVMADDAYARGACALFSKPFNLKELTGAVDRFLMTPQERIKEIADSTIANKIVMDIATSLRPAVGDEKISLGQGGLFLINTEASFEVGSRAYFCIRFSNGDVLTMEGTGVIRWKRGNGGELPPGYGIEFESLSKQCRDLVLGLIESLNSIAFIPKS